MKKVTSWLRGWLNRRLGIISPSEGFLVANKVFMENIRAGIEGKPPPQIDQVWQGTLGRPITPAEERMVEFYLPQLGAPFAWWVGDEEDNEKEPAG